MNISKIRGIIEETLDGKFKVLSVEYVLENKHNYLRITIDTIDLEDCIKASKLVGPVIEDSNLTTDKYFLEVGSREEGEK